jgi:hypothetical protein
LEIGSSIREAWESINRAVAEEEVLGDVIQESIYNVVAAEQLVFCLLLKWKSERKTSRWKSNDSEP